MGRQDTSLENEADQMTMNKEPINLVHGAGTLSGVKKATSRNAR